MVVLGANGHSRLREWVLGGVTRDVLHRPPVCRLGATDAQGRPVPVKTVLSQVTTLP
ncbi:universal stress protein [Methylorubrum extorquens]|uniref:universal stress protein n=1 Tax=Methylorubrum extorquens TaxID=408 RepID=UPI003137B4E8